MLGVLLGVDTVKKTALQWLLNGDPWLLIGILRILGVLSADRAPSRNGARAAASQPPSIAAIPPPLPHPTPSFPLCLHSRCRVPTAPRRRRVPHCHAPSARGAAPRVPPSAAMARPSVSLSAAAVVVGLAAAALAPPTPLLPRAVRDVVLGVRWVSTAGGVARRGPTRPPCGSAVARGAVRRRGDLWCASRGRGDGRALGLYEWSYGCVAAESGGWWLLARCSHASLLLFRWCRTAVLLGSGHRAHVPPPAVVRVPYSTPPPASMRPPPCPTPPRAPPPPPSPARRTRAAARLCGRAVLLRVARPHWLRARHLPRRARGRRRVDGRPRCRALGVGGSEERRVGKECRSRWSPYH